MPKLLPKKLSELLKKSKKKGLLKQSLFEFHQAATQSLPSFLKVNVPSGLLERIPPDRRDALLAVLAQDPRPAYQNTPDRVYGMEYAGFEIRFTVSGHTLTVCEIIAE